MRLQRNYIDIILYIVNKWPEWLEAFENFFTKLLWICYMLIGSTSEINDFWHGLYIISHPPDNCNFKIFNSINETLMWISHAANILSSFYKLRRRCVSALLNEYYTESSATIIPPSLEGRSGAATGSDSLVSPSFLSL